VSVAIYDVLGREVKVSAFVGLTIGPNSYTLDLPDLQDGIYFVRIKCGEQIRTLPFEIRK
jgi:hypothetical protein